MLYNDDDLVVYHSRDIKELLSINSNLRKYVLFLQIGIISFIILAVSLLCLIFFYAKKIGYDTAIKDIQNNKLKIEVKYSHKKVKGK